jgi:hypothetical protein
MARLVGYAEHELRALRVPDLMAARPRLSAAERRRFHHEGRWWGQLRLRRKDGGAVPVRADVVAERVPGGVYVTTFTPSPARDPAAPASACAQMRGLGERRAVHAGLALLVLLACVASRVAPWPRLFARRRPV